MHAVILSLKLTNSYGVLEDRRFANKSEICFLSYINTKNKEKIDWAREWQFGRVVGCHSKNLKPESKKIRLNGVTNVACGHPKFCIVVVNVKYGHF